MHEATALVVVVLISVSLGQLSGVEKVQCLPKSGNKRKLITKNNPNQELTSLLLLQFYDNGLINYELKGSVLIFQMNS